MAARRTRPRSTTGSPASRKGGGPRRREPPGPAGGVSVLTGIHAVREALRAQRRAIRRLLLRRGARSAELGEIEVLARRLGVEVREVEGDELGAGERGENAQGVGLEAGPVPELTLDALLGQLERPCCLVALDGVEDPQNVGAIARVAEAAGAAGLILTERRAPPLSPALARASAGAIEWLPVARVGNLSRALEVLKGAGFWVAGAEVEAATGLYDVSDATLRGDLVVVMGAEGRGLRPSIRALVDHPLAIPMSGRVESLNVATAAAVILFEIGRRSGLRGFG